MTQARSFLPHVTTPEARARDDQATRLRSLVEHAQQSTTTNKTGRQPAISLPTPGVAPQAPVSPPERPRIITVASGKGGVGKTNLCVNLAASCANAGLRTWLIDGDFGLANAEVLCAINTPMHIGQVIEQGRSLEQIAVPAPGGFQLVSGSSGVARLAHMPEHARHDVIRSISTLHTAADLVIIDCGAGIGAGVLSFLNAADVALVVTTPEPTSIADAYALLKCLITRTTNTPRARAFALLVNQARSEREADTAHRRIDTVAQRFLNTPVPLAGWIPFDEAIPKAVRRRTPFVLASPRARASKALRNLSGRLAPAAGCHWPPDQRRSRRTARKTSPKS